MDPRIDRLARLLVHYSLKVRKGQVVKIQGEAVTMPLMEAAYAEVLRAGGHPYTRIIVPRTEELLHRIGSETQLEFIPQHARIETRRMDCLLVIWGHQNTRSMNGIDPARQAQRRRAMRPLIRQIFSRTGKGELSWVGTQFPTHADAQEADMSLSDYEDFVYRAGHVHTGDPVKHWKTVQKEQTRIKRILERYDRFHLQAASADLSIRAKGRKWISCHGTDNFPDGEIFTSPHESSAEGFVEFSYPASYLGRRVPDVRLEFKKGKVVAESAGQNLDYLQAMLNMDRGARYVGEFAIGTNYEIKRFTGNTLFDEKIGGTCHLAVGASLEETGGKNRSALHWDMVCDLHKDSRITADGTEIYRNGRFTI